MANYNTGDVVRFENGGKMKIGSDEFINIVAGSMEIEVPGRETWRHLDRGVFVARYVGDNRPAKFKCKFKVTKLAAATNPIAALCPADASGKKTLVDVIVERYDYRASTTGDKITLGSSCCPDGYKVNHVAGADSDEIEFNIESEAPGAWTAIT